MSVQAIVWVLEEAPDLPPHLLPTLISIANHADQNGRGGYPSQDLIAWYTRKTDRSVRRDLEQLEEIGLIIRGDQRFVLHLPENKRPVVWDLPMDRKRPPRPDAKRAGRPSKKEQVSEGAEIGGTSTSGVISAPENWGDVDVRPDAGGEIGGTSVVNRGDVDVRQTVLEPSLEPSPPAPAESAGAAPVEQSGGNSLSDADKATLNAAVAYAVEQRPGDARWTSKAVAAAARDQIDAGRKPADVARVLRQAADDRDGTSYPGRIGYLLTAAAKPATVAAAPSWAEGPIKHLDPAVPRCRRHPGNPAKGCGGCKADERAADPGQAPESGPVDGAAAREAARRRAADAARKSITKRPAAGRPASRQGKPTSDALAVLADAAAEVTLPVIDDQAPADLEVPAQRSAADLVGAR